MQAAPSLPWPPKPEDLFAPDRQPPKSLTSFLRAAFAKHTSYNWRNGEVTYLVLLTRYCLFDIQRNIFHCKTHFAWYEISVYFLFFVIYAISDLLKNNSFKLKISVNVLNFQNSTLGLKFGYISYQMSFKKSMIGLKRMSPCLQLNLSSSMLQQLPKYFKINLNYCGHIEKHFIITCQFYSDIFNYRCAFVKITSYCTPLTTLFQLIFFALSVQSVCQGCSIY